MVTDRLPTLNGLREVMDRNAFAVGQADLQRLAAQRGQALIFADLCLAIASDRVQHVAVINEPQQRPPSVPDDDSFGAHFDEAVLRFEDAYPS